MVLTVILPVYNAELYLAEALESLQAQTFRDFTVLAVNDGSTDRSLDILQRYSARDSRFVVIDQPNRKLVPTLNGALDLVRTPLVARQDADDYSHPDRFKKQIDFLNQHSQVGFVGTTFLVSVCGREDVQWIPCRDRHIRNHMLLGNCFAHGSIMVRTDTVRAAGGYPHSSETQHVEDMALWIKLLKITQAHNLPDILYVYREYPQNVSSQSRGQQAEHAKQLTRDFVDYYLQQTPLRVRLQDALDLLDMDRADPYPADRLERMRWVRQQSEQLMREKGYRMDALARADKPHHQIISKIKRLASLATKPAAPPLPSFLPVEDGHAIYLSSRMKMLLNMRLGISAMFDIQTDEGRAGYLGWWFAFGQHQYKGIRQATNQASVAHSLQHNPAIPDDAPLPISRMLCGLYKALDGFSNPEFSLETRQGRRALVRYWYLCFPVGIPGYVPLSDEAERFLQSSISVKDEMNLTQAEDLMGDMLRGNGEKSPAVSPAEIRCWYYLSALLGKERHRCLLPKGENVADFLPRLQKLVIDSWPKYPWLADYTGLTASAAAAFIAENLPDLLKKQSSCVRRYTENNLSLAAGMPLKPGVNIIGYVQGELGIGEDSRMLAAALTDRRVPFSMYNYPRTSAARQGDMSAAQHLSEQNPHKWNVFCLPAVECSWAVAELGDDFFKGHRNVGYWPWELAKWPAEFMNVFEFFDEIWTPSQFIADALMPVSPKPVILMPPAVVAKPAGLKKRADFGLPENPFLFLYAFDFNSSYYRKNPLGCVEAFQRAFPKKDKSVGLVLKCMYPKQDSALFQDFMKRCAADDRIIVLSETMSRGEVLDLFDCCDSFVSLHRAEGFGRGIAEAMLLGKPVIVSAYSGNLDFCKPYNSCLVECREIPIKPEEYWYSAGQVWADPDLDRAAYFMKLVATDKPFRDWITKEAKNYMAVNHSPKAAGKRYRARFKKSGS